MIEIIWSSNVNADYGGPADIINGFHLPLFAKYEISQQERRESHFSLEQGGGEAEGGGEIHEYPMISIYFVSIPLSTSSKCEDTEGFLFYIN